MLPSTHAQRTREQGFTLVELAIVLVIVGLLIGGILKGQELIATTRVTGTASQIRAIEAATNGFFDTYGNMPGDLPNPAGRLPNCATAGSVCNFAGANAGNGRITETPSAVYAIAQENSAFFGQLAAADLISGVIPTAAPAAPTVGQDTLGTPIGQNSQYRVGYHPGGTITDAVAASAPGHYLLISTTSAAIGAAGALANNGVQPKAAQKIDSKYDDGAPITGSVIGGNTTAAAANAGCNNAGVYNSQNTNNDCGVYVRFYQ